jgi:hypothetical protein
VLPEFGGQRLRPDGVPCRERDLVVGDVPEPAYRRADAADSQNRDLHWFLLPVQASSGRDDELAVGRFCSMSVCASAIWSNRYTRPIGTEAVPAATALDPEIMRMGGAAPPMFAFRDPDGNSILIIQGG